MNRTTKRAQGATQIAKKNGIEMASAIHEARKIGASFIQVMPSGLMQHFKGKDFDALVEHEVKKRLELKAKQTLWYKLTHPRLPKRAYDNLRVFFLSAFNKVRKLSA